MPKVVVCDREDELCPLNTFPSWRRTPHPGRRGFSLRLRAGLGSQSQKQCANYGSLCSASAALRLADQGPFIPREDLSYRRVPSDPRSGTVVIDHHSGIGTVPKRDPEIVFPRAALAALVSNGTIGASAPFHYSFMGGVREHERIENELAAALADELAKARVDLALLVPY